jgi:polar amino acid transport system permease protein
MPAEALTLDAPGLGADGRPVPRLAPQPRITRGVILSAAAALVAAAVGIQALATAPAMEWPAFREWLFDGVIFGGVLNTIWLTLACEALAIVSGVLVALLLLSSNPVWHAVAHAYQWGFRSVPEIAQLLFWFNLSLLFPTLTVGLPFDGPAFYSTSTNAVMTPWVAAIVALGLHEGAYLAEVFRSGVRSVDRGQREVARSLGLSRRRITLQIVLPQAMRTIAPNAGSRLIGTLKLTSLASLVAIPELLYRVENVYSRTFQTIPLLLVATAWYMLLVAGLRLLQGWIERRFGQRAADAGVGA